MKVIAKGKGVVIGIEPFGKEQLDTLQNLKVVGTSTTGLDHIDVGELKSRGIKLISLRDYPNFTKDITSTAEHTIGLIIGLLRNYRTALHPPYGDREEYKGQRLSGKTLGIVGLGRVGKQVKQIAEAIDMKTLIVDQDLVGLTSLLQKSDIVTLHIPLDSNEGFFTKDMFSQMKQGAYFINTSRSGVVEKRALFWALSNEMIKGAAVDFIDDAELIQYSRLHDNLILTPHIGGVTWEDREATENFITKEVEKLLRKV